MILYVYRILELQIQSAWIAGLSWRILVIFGNIYILFDTVYNLIRPVRLSIVLQTAWVLTVHHLWFYHRIQE